MTLARALSASTDARIRARGAEYHAAGAVIHFDPQPQFAYAVVRGSDDYVVRLDVANRIVRGTCTCPHFTDHLEPCKHLWAVVLACDARNVLQLPDTARPLDIRFVAVPLAEDPVDATPDAEDDWTLDDPEIGRAHV